MDEDNGFQVHWRDTTVSSSSNDITFIGIKPPHIRNEHITVRIVVAEKL